MKKNPADDFVSMMSLESDFENIGKRKIPINKFASRIFKKAREQAKDATCHLCGKPCTSFCNSHSVPHFTLENIAENGKVEETLQGALPTSPKDTGLNQAGTFHLICHDCDNTVFKDYENPDAYQKPPSDIMLAQIAVKNYLQMISKRKVESKLYDLLEQRFDNYTSFPSEGVTVEEIDMREYQQRLQYAVKSLANKGTDRYYLCFHKILDYVVPYAVQTTIPLIVDLEGNLINNIYNFSEKYRLEYIQVAVFPLKSSSVVIMFVESDTKRYRKFIRQLKKLDDDDQLAAINYLIFSYTENVFLNPSLRKALKKNHDFMKVCQKTTMAHSPFGMANPLEKAMQEYSFDGRHAIPNLLSRQYALR